MIYFKHDFTLQRFARLYTALGHQTLKIHVFNLLITSFINLTMVIYFFHSGSPWKPCLHHGYIHLGKYLLYSLGKYTWTWATTPETVHDQRLTSLIFHYMQWLPRSKCPRRDSNPGGECNNQISQPPKLCPMDRISTF